MKLRVSISFCLVAVAAGTIGLWVLLHYKDFRVEYWLTRLRSSYFDDEQLTAATNLSKIGSEEVVLPILEWMGELDVSTETVDSLLEQTMKIGDRLAARHSETMGEILNNEDLRWDIRLLAATYLDSLGDKAVPYFDEALEANDPRIREFVSLILPDGDGRSTASSGAGGEPRVGDTTARSDSSDVEAKDTDGSEFDDILNLE